jgi:hypothetical protein
MRAASVYALLGVAIIAAVPEAIAAPATKRDVDTRYPYTGPKVPVGDWVDNTVNGNVKGLVRLVQAPAVAPPTPSNSINVNASIGFESLREVADTHDQPGDLASFHTQWNGSAFPNSIRSRWASIHPLGHTTGQSLQHRCRIYDYLRPDASLLPCDDDHVQSILPQYPPGKPPPRDYVLLQHTQQQWHHCLAHIEFYDRPGCGRQTGVHASCACRYGLY